MKPQKLQQNILMFTSILAALLVAPRVFAVEALSTVELISHCDKYHDESASEDRTFCVRYIQGFIDGAVATDERVTNNVTQEYAQRETYSERATRTRIGDRLARYGTSVYAEFCLGDPVPLVEVVERVVADLTCAETTAQYPLARDLVYLSLRTHYPCLIED